MPVKRKGSPFWWASYTDANGKRVRSSLETTNHKEAVALEAKLKLEAYRVKQWQHQPTRVYDELMLSYLKATESKRSHRRDLDSARHLTQYFKGRDLAELKASDVRSYQDWRLSQTSFKGPVKPSTVNRETAVLSTAINYAKREWDWEIPNPVTGRKLSEPEGRDRHLSLSEVAALVTVAERRTPYLADFIELAIHTGCRKQELLGLEWDRVDLKRGLFYLEGVHTKSGKRRSIPINETARLRFISRIRFRARCCPDSPWVFCHKNGGRLKDLKKSFGTVCRLAGIKDFRIHDLRHTCASLAVQEGVPLTAIRDLLGHSSVTVTERYAHHAPEHVRDAVAALDRYRAQSGHTGVVPLRTNKAGGS